MEVLDLGTDRLMDLEERRVCQVIRGQTMKCFIGIEKKLEGNTMFYREPVKIDKDWSDMIRSWLRGTRKEF